MVKINFVANHKIKKFISDSQIFSYGYFQTRK